jgi:hypothetical protein
MVNKHTAFPLRAVQLFKQWVVTHTASNLTVAQLYFIFTVNVSATYFELKVVLGYSYFNGKYRH